MKWTMRKLASAITKREGRNHQASIGDVREILKILVDLNKEYHGSPLILLMNESLGLNTVKTEKGKL